MYDFLFALFALFYLPAFFLKGKHRNGAWRARLLGEVPADARRALAGRRVLWLHAVSVGEVVLALRLAASLKERFPGAKVLLTTTTAAGREVAGKIKADDDTLLWFPADFRFAVKAFADAVKPSALILLETEIWPNLIRELSARKVPVFIVNGRISDRSIGAYRSLRGLLGPVLRLLSGIGAQDETMRSRFVELGADPARTVVTGNVKFDWQPPVDREGAAAAIEKKIKTPGTFLCVAGSTHEGEEEALFGMFESIRRSRPEFRLLIAPRHLERLPAIEAAAAKLGVKTRRVAEGGGDGGAVWLLDRMGVLATLYRAADAVFVGGSLVPRGGHNLVEPAYYEKPLFFGPYMQNFREMADAFLKDGAAVQVKDAEDLERQLAALLGDGERRKSLGQAARRLVSRHQGATRRNIDALLASL
ncbi:MAG TPA: 3-deoxy-D-manno-octulosonic acid transferase [Candidatus Eisenbacteria bacterium]|nr:3-deoxy-D-manno-octulosonic acid transferase [Candidatus Eisenbacteria bacterium]